MGLVFSWNLMELYGINVMGHFFWIYGDRRPFYGIQFDFMGFCCIFEHILRCTEQFWIEGVTENLVRHILAILMEQILKPWTFEGTLFSDKAAIHAISGGK